MAPSDVDAGAEAVSSDAPAGGDAATRTLEKVLAAQRERKQAVIETISYRECAELRAIGTRYEQGAALPVLRGEFDRSLAELRTTLQTYCLLHREPPSLPDRSYNNARRYFMDHAGLAALDAHSEAAAKRDIRWFVARTLEAGDRESVTLSRDLPPIDHAAQRAFTAVTPEASTDGLETIDWSGQGSEPFGALRTAMNGGLRSWLLDDGLRAFDSVVRQQRLGSPLLRSTVGASLAASSLSVTGGAAGFPAAPELWRPTLRGVMQAVTPLVEQSVSGPWPAVPSLHGAGLGVFDDRLFSQLAELARQLETAGADPIGGPTSGVSPRDEALSEPSARTIGPPLAPADRGPDSPVDVLWAAVDPENVEHLQGWVYACTQAVLLHLQWEYPAHNVSIGTVQIVVGLFIQQWAQTVQDRR